jgi:hypothetical protein
MSTQLVEVVVDLPGAVTAEVVGIYANNLPPPNPVAVPELVKVAPLGTVNVSPESPNVNAVPVAGLILLTFNSDITYSFKLLC